MTNRISFTSVLRSKAQSRKSNQKEPQYFPEQTQWPSLIELMERFMEYPDDSEEEFTLSFAPLAHASQRTSTFDSRQTQREQFGNFDDWIAAQAKQENKQNIYDSQPRATQKQGTKKTLKLPVMNPGKPGKQIISSKNKMPMGKLCMMFKDHEISESVDPVYKCDPSSSIQSSSSSAEYCKSSKEGSKNNPYLNYDISSDNSRSQQGSDLNYHRNHYEEQKQATKGSERDPNDIKIKFCKIKSEKMEDVLERQKLVQPITYSRDKQPAMISVNLPEKKGNIKYSVSSSQGESKVGSPKLTLIKSKEEIKKKVIQQVEDLAHDIVREREKNMQEDDEMLLNQYRQSMTKRNHQGELRQPERANCSDHNERKIDQVKRELNEILQLKNNERNKKMNEFLNQDDTQQETRKQQNHPPAEQREPYFKHHNMYVNEKTSAKLCDQNDKQSNSQVNNEQDVGTFGVGYSFAQNYQRRPSEAEGVKDSFSNKKQASFQSSINNSSNIAMRRVEEEQEENQIPSQSQNFRNFKKYVEASDSNIPRIQSVDFGDAQNFTDLKPTVQRANFQQSKPEYLEIKEPLHEEIYEQQLLSSLGQRANQSFQKISEPKVTEVNISLKSLTKSKQEFIVENSIPGDIKRSKIIDDDEVVQEEDDENSEQIKEASTQLIKTESFPQGALNAVKESNIQPQKIFSVAKSIESIIVEDTYMRNSKKKTEIEDILSNSKVEQRCSELPQNLSTPFTKEKDIKFCIQNSTLADQLQTPQVKKQEITISVEKPQLQDNSTCTMAKPSTQRRQSIKTSFEASKPEEIRPLTSNESTNQINFSLNLCNSVSNLKKENMQVSIGKETPKPALISSRQLATKTVAPSVKQSQHLKNSAVMKSSLLKKSAKFSNNDDQLELEFDFD